MNQLDATTAPSCNRRPLTSVQRFIDSHDNSNSRMGPEPEFSKLEYS